MDLTPGQQSDHYKQTTSLIFRWMRDAETATPKALYRMLDGAGLLLTDKGVEEIRQAAYRAGREDAAKAIEDSDVIYAWQAVDVARGLQPQEEPWQRRAAATGGGPCHTCGKPFYTHVCLSCSPDYQTPGPGCINCRNTGMDQTPCAAPGTANTERGSE